MAKRRTQWGENWDSAVLVEHMWDNFDLVVIKVIWGHLVPTQKLLLVNFEVSNLKKKWKKIKI